MFGTPVKGTLSTDVIVTDPPLNGMRAVHVEMCEASVDGMGRKLNMTVWVSDGGSRRDIALIGVEAARAVAFRILENRMNGDGRPWLRRDIRSDREAPVHCRHRVDGARSPAGAQDSLNSRVASLTGIHVSSLTADSLRHAFVHFSEQVADRQFRVTVQVWICDGGSPAEMEKRAIRAARAFMAQTLREALRNA